MVCRDGAEGEGSVFSHWVWGGEGVKNSINVAYAIRRKHLKLSHLCSNLYSLFLGILLDATCQAHVDACPLSFVIILSVIKGK